MSGASKSVLTSFVAGLSFRLCTCRKQCSCGARHRVQNGAAERSVKQEPGSAVEWLTEEHASVAADPTVLTVEMPVLPRMSVELPGQKSQVDVMENDATCRKMYDDLLVSGTRRFLMPFTVPRANDYESGLGALRIHAVGAIMQMEDLQDADKVANKDVKFHVDHSVLGIGRIVRLLNPEVLRKAGGDDYLRAEVELLVDDEETGSQIGTKVGSSINEQAPQEAWKAELEEVWEDLNQVLKRTSQPWWCDYDEVRRTFDRTSSWGLISMWHELSLLRHRQAQQNLLLAALRTCIERARHQSRIGNSVFQNGFSSLNDLREAGVPEKLLQDYMEVFKKGKMQHRPEDVESLWSPFLQMVAAKSSEDRGQLLLLHSRHELALIKAREQFERQLST